MKNLLLLIALLYSQLTFGQASFGIKGGVVSSKFTPKGYSIYQGNYVSGVLGGFGNYAINKNVSLQLEFLYINKGGSVKSTNLVDPTGKPYATLNGYQLSAKYFDVPLLLKLSAGNKVAPYLNLGFAPSFYISGREEAPKGKINGSVATKDLSINKVNAYGLIGAGIEFEISDKTSFALEARYNYGLTNSISGMQGYVDVYQNGKTNSILLMGALRFK